MIAVSRSLWFVETYSQVHLRTISVTWFGDDLNYGAAAQGVMLNPAPLQAGPYD